MLDLQLLHGQGEGGRPLITPLARSPDCSEWPVSHSWTLNPHQLYGHPQAWLKEGGKGLRYKRQPAIFMVNQSCAVPIKQHEYDTASLDCVEQIFPSIFWQRAGFVLIFFMECNTFHVYFIYMYIICTETMLFTISIPPQTNLEVP